MAFKKAIIPTSEGEGGVLNVRTPVKSVKSEIWMKISRACFYLLAFAAPLLFLPLTTNPVEINKQIFVGIIVVAALVFYLINFFEKGKISYPKSLLGLSVLVFFVVSLASAFFSVSRATSIYGNFIQPDTIFVFLISGLAFFLTAALFRREDIKKLGLYFLAGLFLATIFVLLQMFGKYILPWDFSHRVSFNTIGTVFNLATWLFFGLILIIGIIFNFELSRPAKIILSLLGLLIGIELVVFNYSSLWLLGVLILALLAAYKFIKAGKVSSALVVIISLFLFLGLVSQFIPALVSFPVEVRPNLLATWQVAAGQMSGVRSVLGSGSATFGYDYAISRPLSLNQTDFWFMRFNQGFNFFLVILATMGMLGLVAIIFVIFSFVWEILKLATTPELLTLVAGLAFLFAAWLFTPSFFVQTFFIFFGLGLVAALSSDKKEITGANFSRAKLFVLFFILIFLFAASFASIFFVGKKYLASVYYAQALASYNQTGDPSPAINKMAGAIELDSTSDIYYRAVSQLLLANIDKLAATPASKDAKATETLRAEVQNNIAAAIEYARRATVANGADSENWNNLGNVYERLIPVASGSDAFALDNYKKAMELDPKNPQEPVNAARTLLAASDAAGAANNADLKKSKLAEAKTYLDKSIELKSDYAPAHYLFAVIAVREGKTDEAIRRLEEAKKSASYDAGLAFQLGTLYYDGKQLREARREFERAVAIDPNYSNARYFLGLIYDQTGDKNAAIAQFEKIAEANPDNKEVKDILANLKAGKPAITAAPAGASNLNAPVPEANK